MENHAYHCKSVLQSAGMEIDYPKPTGHITPTKFWAPQFYC